MKSLIKTIGALMVVLGMAATAQATLYTFNFSGGEIPNGNTVGTSFTTADLGTLDGGAGVGFGTDIRITDVNVRLEITGGYNGDLYGYLVHSSGFAVLLNRVGTGSGGEPQNTFGFSTSGFGAITLDDETTYGNIHDQLNPAGGTWKSDGLTLNDFNTLNPNGTWTLFLADLAGGGDPATLVSWGLDIEAVPEPVTWALIGFGLIFGGVTTARVIRARRLACVRCPAGK
jgi:subtilisin-like proprotein convertase family protein